MCAILAAIERVIHQFSVLHLSLSCYKHVGVVRAQAGRIGRMAYSLMSWSLGGLLRRQPPGEGTPQLWLQPF